MTCAEVMKKLEASGTAQNRKVYQRQGAGSNLFGVSFANLDKLKKQINTDHLLAQRLWNSGNVDARHLATLVADPKRVTEEELDKWVKDLDYYVITDLFARHLASQSPLAKLKAEEWIKSSEEWIGQAGWVVMAILTMQGNDLPDSYFERLLEIIKRDIHNSKNRVRYAMNNALIAIGIRNDNLQKKALAVAKTIGEVEVDHGETNCKTPDAAAYILKTIAYRKRKK